MSFRFPWNIAHLRGPDDVKVYSLRLSEEMRAIGYRDGKFLREVSLHPDHDSTWDR